MAATKDIIYLDFTPEASKSLKRLSAIEGNDNNAQTVRVGLAIHDHITTNFGKDADVTITNRKTGEAINISIKQLKKSK